MKKIKICAFIIFIGLVILTYFWTRSDFVKYSYIAHCTYDSSKYIYSLGSSPEDEYLDFYYPTWELYENKDDLINNDIGIDLSQIDLSSVDFKTNNVVVALGAKIRLIKYYNNSLAVDVLASARDNDDVYIYKIPKLHIQKNELAGSSGMFFSKISFIVDYIIYDKIGSIFDIA